MGRKKAPGNPLVYRTSEKFLQYFGLNSLEELPSEEEIAKILQEEKKLRTIASKSKFHLYLELTKAPASYSIEHYSDFV